MHLTDRQQLFFDYLLERLDFLPDSFLQEYIKALFFHCQDFLYMAAKPIEKEKNTDEIIYPADHKYKEYIVQDRWFVPTKFNIIDLLMLECDIKYKHKYSKKKINKNIISATDIANYTYCPVSFAISNTFHVAKVVSAQLGASFHEQHRLLNFIRSQNTDGKIVTPSQDISRIRNTIHSDDTAKEMLADLNDSIAVFVGTTNNKENNKFFISRNGTYTGKPDYIFCNNRTKKYYVIEEKFQRIPRAPSKDVTQEWCETYGYDPNAIEKVRSKTVFYDNHLNQLRSYLFGIKDYQISYGYVVYWRYSYEHNSDKNKKDEYTPQMEQIRSRKIDAGDMHNRDTVVKVYKDIKKIMQSGYRIFDKSKRNPAKCAGCVVGPLCGHKTGRFDRFTFPYSESYLGTKKVPFPEELRKIDITSFE